MFYFLGANALLLLFVAVFPSIPLCSIRSLYVLLSCCVYCFTSNCCTMKNCVQIEGKQSCFRYELIVKALWMYVCMCIEAPMDYSSSSIDFQLVAVKKALRSISNQCYFNIIRGNDVFLHKFGDFYKNST